MVRVAFHSHPRRPRRRRPVSLVVWEWFYKDPIVEVRLFRNLNFLGANAMMFILGIMLFSSLVMMPLFLQTLLGYTAESAGLVLPAAASCSCSDARRWGARLQGPGALHHRLWLADTLHRHVLFHSAARSRNQFGAPA